MTLPRFPKFCNACKLILCAKVTIFISLQDNACNHIFHLFTDNEETPEYGTGVRQSSNAKITFNDEEYFQKVTLLLHVTVDIVTVVLAEV